MPIAPENRKFYGRRWREVTRPKILARSGGICEGCGRCPRHIEVAHLDHTPAHDDDGNLRAWCSTCHRRHDYPRWLMNSRETRCARKDQARPLLKDLNGTTTL